VNPAEAEMTGMLFAFVTAMSCASASNADPLRMPTVSDARARVSRNEASTDELEVSRIVRNAMARREWLTKPPLRRRRDRPG
jgi:hypothetical protein